MYIFVNSSLVLKDWNFGGTLARLLNKMNYDFK